MPNGIDLLWTIATETPDERRARIWDEVRAESAKLPPEVRQAREDAWNALTPEQKAAKKQQNMLWLLGRLEQYADRALTSFDGNDQPMYHGGPGMEGVVVGDSAIGFFRRIKERIAETSVRVHNGEPPF
jgi:hypothetical protein